MAKLSATIMAHPKRKELWSPLQKSLGISVTLDEKNDRWDTGRRSVLNYDPSCTHHMVVQDDAVVPKDFLEGVEYWCGTHPDAVLCLYSGKIRQMKHIVNEFSRPPCFIKMTKIEWGVALVFPTNIIEPMIEYGDQRPEVKNYDMRLGLWTQRNSYPVLYPQASWVNHQETPSLVEGRSGTRKAASFIEADSSLLNWGRGTNVPIIEVPNFSRRSEKKRAKYVRMNGRRVTNKKPFRQ